MTLAASVVYPAASAASALKLSTRWIPVSDDGRRKEAPGLIMASVSSSSHSSVMTAMSSLWLESSMMLGSPRERRWEDSMGTTCSRQLSSGMSPLRNYNSSLAPVARR